MAVERGAKDWTPFLRQACGPDDALFQEVAKLVEEDLRIAVSDVSPTIIAGRFRVYRQVGTGTFGDVYKVFDENTHLDVALKVLRDSNSESIRRFKGEFRRLSNVIHPNIVKLYDFIEQESQWMFTMQFVDGVDFLAYVRNQTEGVTIQNQERPPYSEHRLRDALLQLATGLSALHDRKLVHRDLKPSNVLITQSGELVLVDFGLVRQTGEEIQRSRTLAGTVAYMAPEQSEEHLPRDSNDWYAVGVMLYEALTGHIPFHGSAWIEVLKKKRTDDPVRPSRLAPEVPKDLDELCVGLLRRDPNQRFGFNEVVNCIGHKNPPLTARAALKTSPAFVGRQAELEALNSAYLLTEQGTPATVHIFGASGIGKTVLIREFLERVRFDDPKPLVFAGRCYERESVTYKGLDDLVDQVSVYLRNLPIEKLEQILPRNFSLLSRMFPVLRDLRPVDGRVSQDISFSPESRSRAFAALTEMLGRLAERNRVILAIDDLQWGDLDASAFLRDLMRSAEAPSLLLLLAYRSEDAEHCPWLQLLRDEANDSLHGKTMMLQLGRLSAGDALELARSLAPTEASVEEQLLRKAVGQTGDDPFLVHQVAWWLTSCHRDAASLEGDFRIDDVLETRIMALDPEERRILELIAIAGQPTACSVFESCTDPPSLSMARDLMVGARLLRSRTAQGVEEIDVYHDRIRNAVVNNLKADTRRTRHEELARALEASGSDWERLSFHYEHAEQHEKAGAYALRAADHAAEALAFNKAARLYESAFKLGRWNDSELCLIGRKMGDALYSAGRGADAADAYLKAASRATAREKMSLTSAAAGQLVRSGQFERATALLDELLRRERFVSLRNESAVIAWVALSRLWLKIRGLKFRERSASEISDSELLRLDVCWAAVLVFTLTDPLRGADFSTRYALLALNSGEPRRISIALAAEAAQLSIASRGRNMKRVQDLLQQASNLAERVQDTHASAFARVMSSFIAYIEGDWQRASEEGDAAVKMLNCKPAGAAWELTTAINFSLIGRTATGRWKENRQRLPELLREAESRKDLYALLALRMTGNAYVADLVDDRPDDALRQLRNDVSSWPYAGYDLQKCNALMAETDIALYCGNPSMAWEKIQREWPLIIRSRLLWFPPTLAISVFARARAALAMARHCAAKERESRRFLRLAERDARLLGRKAPEWGRGFAGLVRCCVASFDRDAAKLDQSLADAERLLRASGMIPFLAAVCYRRAQLEKTPLPDEIRQWFEREEIRKPERIAAVLTPGLWPERPL